MPEETPDPALNGDERTTLNGFLEEQRSTLAWKCQGLSDAQLKEPSAPPSRLSLLGLVRHMAEVERGWFRQTLSKEAIGDIWCSEEHRDAEFDDVADADVGEAFSSWAAECRKAREILEALPSLEVTFTTSHGEVLSVRWMVNHMIEEYSRHNGHADLIRERIDGKTGDFPPPAERVPPPGLS
ncbi:MAG: DinB family protein [Candidatus Dormiibacterota bacterium]